MANKENRAGKENKRKSGIFDNLFLKIFSLVCSFVVWLLVTSVNDPVKVMTVTNVPVRLLHTNLITDQGEVYSVLDDTDVVPVVTVRARRSIIDGLDPDNIVASADVENITSLNTVEIRFYSTKYNSDIDSITGSISNVKLSIEEKRSRSFTLTMRTAGTVADGYQLGTVNPEQNQVRVSGPESVVTNIASAVATVDVSGATGNISTYSDIRLYDEDGTEISTSNLTMNISSVKVSVTVLPVTEVPITAQYQGTPADGYLLSGLFTIDPSAVELAGRSSVLSTVQSIVIPADQLDLTGATDTVTKQINITPYLPEGITLADDGFDGTVTVTVGIEPAETVAVETEISSVALGNVPEGYSAEIISVSDGTSTAVPAAGTNTFSFVFSGLASEVDSIRAADLSPSIDVGELVSGKTGDLSGTYDASVTIVQPQDATLQNNVTARVRLSAVGAPASEETAETAETAQTQESSEEENE